jgi:hypothetical protein
MGRPKKEVEYEKGDLLVENMIEQIVNKDKNFLHISPMQIKILKVNGKKRKVPVVIKGMPEPLNLLVNFKYVIYIYSESFEELSETKQFIQIYRVLSSTSDDFDGKIRRKDVSDYSDIISKFGLFWEYEDDVLLQGKLGLKAAKVKVFEDLQEDVYEDGEKTEQ